VKRRALAGPDLEGKPLEEMIMADLDDFKSIDLAKNYYNVLDEIETKEIIT